MKQKHNKWFEETFLASLKNEQWLSEKQVAVCMRYMRSSEFAGKYYLVVKNMRYEVYVKNKGYGKFYAEEYPYNIEYADGSEQQYKIAELKKSAEEKKKKYPDKEKQVDEWLARCIKREEEKLAEINAEIKRRKELE